MKYKNLTTEELDLLREPPLCYFCGEAPKYIYASSRMSTGEACECWRWCVCHDCHAALDREDWAIIRFRMIYRLEKIQKIPRSYYVTIIDNVLGYFFQDAVKHV